MNYTASQQYSILSFPSFVAIEFSASSSSTFLQHSLLCYDILFVVLLNLCQENIFFYRDRVSHSCMLLLSQQTFSLS